MIVATSALLLAASAIVLLLWRFQRPVAEVVQARKFEVVDETGKVLVEIGETLEGGGAVVTRSRSSDADETVEVEQSVAQPEQDRTQDQVKVQLSYRGDGLYEAKVTPSRSRPTDD